MHEQLNLLNADLDAIIDATAAEPQPQEQADEAAPARSITPSTRTRPAGHMK